jgi:hypothetical protein
MHCIYLNVLKHFCNFWFASSFQQCIFSLYHNLEKGNKIHLSIKLPYNNWREFQPLESYNDWKAAEFRYFFPNFFIFYF